MVGMIAPSMDDLGVVVAKVAPVELEDCLSGLADPAVLDSKLAVLCLFALVCSDGFALVEVVAKVSVSCNCSLNYLWLHQHRILVF